MEAAPAHAMLIPLTSGPGNGRSFAQPSRLKRCRLEAHLSLMLSPVEAPQSDRSSQFPELQAAGGTGRVMDGRAGVRGSPPPASALTALRPGTRRVPLGRSQPSSSALVLTGPPSRGCGQVQGGRRAASRATRLPDENGLAVRLTGISGLR